MQSLRITNYYSTSLYVKPNDISTHVWNNFTCDYPRCGEEISLPLENGSRYMKTAAIMMAAITDSLVSWQNIDVLHDIRDSLYADSKQTQKIVCDYNKFVSQITPIYYKNNKFSFEEGCNHIKQQREYIYSHLNNQEGIETLFNVYRGVVLSLYMQPNSGLVRNGKRLSKQEALLELFGGLTEDDQFIIKDHHHVSLSQMLGLPIHFYYNSSDGQQLIRKRVHQLANIRYTVALLFEPGYNNKSAKSVRILYQQHDSVYFNNLATLHQTVQKRKDMILAINKIQKALETTIITSVSHCQNIIAQKDYQQLWPDDFYQDLLALVQSLNFKTIKLDEIQQSLDYNLMNQLDAFKTQIKGLMDASPSKPKIFQSTYFKNQQAIYNYQHRNLQNPYLQTELKQVEALGKITSSQILNSFQSPEKGLMRPPKLTPPQQTTTDKPGSISPQSSHQQLTKSMDFHDKAYKFGRPIIKESQTMNQQSNQ